MLQAHKTPATDLVEKIAASLKAYSPATASTQPNLAAALNDALTNTGQLVRARLTYMGCMAQNQPEAVALSLATAVEYFHIASLLLDDLPGMDNAMTRRGHPCLHRIHGEATTLLAALALINRAYALMHQALNTLPGYARDKAGACVEHILGTNGILDGQSRDLHYATTPHSPREVLRVALKKTATLFMLCVYLPALFGTRGREQDRDLRALCIYWGLLYQIADDLNDALCASSETGKTAGRDLQLDRPNYVHATNITLARSRLNRLITLSTRAIDRLALEERWSYLATFHHGYFSELWSKAVQPNRRSAA